MNIDTKLAEKFELAVPVESTAVTVIEAPVEAVVLDDIDADMAKARKTLNNLIDESVLALGSLIKVANSTENPRAYEVVSQMIKATADISKDLLTIHKTRKELIPGDEDTVKKTSIGTQQNIFVGSTNDLLRALTAAGLKGSAHTELIYGQAQEVLPRE